MLFKLHNATAGGTVTSKLAQSFPVQAEPDFTPR